MSQELEKREAQLQEERSLHAKALEVACSGSKICLGNPHLDVLKDTVRPDWICMRVVPLEWIGLEKDINSYMFFLFFYSLLNI
jgi:hypothetical protein